jgi:hypothetical protein
MSLGKVMIAGVFLLPAAALTNQPAHASSREVQLIPDRQTLTEHLRSLGFKTRGGVDRDASARDEARGRSFPHFSSSFSVNGVTYPFTMVGHPPASGRSTLARSVIVPLRMNFVNFGSNGNISHTFEPGPAVTNMTHSPLYKSAAYPGGFFGQFGDSMQRAAFWNQMDHEHRWHVVMDEPQVLAAVDIEVTPETGQLSQDTAGNFMGNVFIDFMDSQIRTILQFLDLDADIVPIFVTDDVTAEALGYHTAFALDADGDRLQTFIYTSWLDPALVPPIFADVSTFNHELLEWMNDPFINNAAPDWFYPPPTDARTVCSQNPFLEVGDPQGNGPTFDDFPAAVITIDGVAYHLQQLVLWQWFADQVPSSAFGGWYTFPIPSSLTVPAVYCP